MHVNSTIIHQVALNHLLTGIQFTYSNPI